LNVYELTGLNLLHGLNMSKNKKRRNERKSSIKGKEEIKRELKVPSYFTYIFGILLLAAFALSLYLRTVMPYDSVFRNGIVAFASDDAVFHMRLVENTLYNFPHQIFYDAFTIYPYGSRIHWGPLFTQIIATLPLIAGLGSYNMQTVNTIAAFFPSVLGALVVFPVYYIGKHLVNRSTGLFAAFMIAMLPGQFFSRSTLGFTDNHVAEVLFSTATIAFFILALKSGREKNIKFSEVRLSEKSVVYSIFAGIMLAAYLLSWPGGPFFAMIISIFILIQYIIDDMLGRSTDYLAVAAVPMFLVDLILVLPYFHPEYGFGFVFYSWFHVAVALIGMLLPIVLSVISREVKRRGYKPYYYPLFLGGFFVLSMLVIKIVLPQMYDAMVNAPLQIFEVHTGGSNTIAEVTSIFAEQNKGMLWSNFPVTGFLQNDNSVLLLILAVLLIFSYRIVRKQKPEDMLFLVWGIVMLLAMYGQNRWAYYFAVNLALIVGYAGAVLSGRILKYSEWHFDKNYLKNIDFAHMLSLVLVIAFILFFVYPSLIVTAIGTYDKNGNVIQQPISKWGGGEPSGGGFAEWLEALNWMRNNTPDPGLNYLAMYEMPKNGTYPYSETAYGVMSWWDYGHIITYWAHRIPNANPFQGGIGGGSTHAPGAATFLTAKSEEEANSVLNALGSNGKPGARYIISNAYMAYNIMDVFGIWNKDNGYRVQIQTSQGPQVVPSSRYYDNMEAKLHIFDGNGLKNYRLVHESPINPYTQGGNEEQWYKNVYNVLYGGKIPVENSGLVKVFEYVKGAKITGLAPPNTTVTLMNTIKTNIVRTIQYSQTTTSNGTYEFTVPYSTLGPIPGETQFDTKPTGSYTVTFGNASKQIDVSEKDVLEGNTVTLNLI
jgi:oligosaccharyl transferase (archaeosortase A-associated)